MTRDGNSHKERGKTGTQQRQRNQQRRPPRYLQGPGNSMRAARGAKRMQDMAAEAGTRSRAQRRAAESDGWGKSPG